MRKRHLAFIGLAVLIGIGELQARAGGGGGFSGGGGGGGFSGGGGGGFSGGGGGDGDGDLGILIYLLFRLCVEHPFIGIPLVAVLGWAFFFYGKKGYNGSVGYHQGSVIRKGRAMQEQRMREVALGNLRERDPGFDEGAFCRRVGLAFLKIQNAWCAHDLRQVEAFISDGVDERFSLQIQEQQEEGWRDHMENIQIHRTRIVQVKSDSVYDVITVELHCSAVDYRVNLRTGMKTSGSSADSSFTEYWSFIRRPDAKTLAAGGLIEGQCPNCGSPLELNESAQCGSCLSLVKSGAYDWVLAEITQASEWVATEDVAYPGLPAMMKKDPGFSFQALEDKTSVMFWRLMASYRSGKSDPIRKMATDACVERLAGELAADAQGNRSYPGDCAVGGVESLGVIPGDDGDRALVKVRWSGSMHRQTANGERTRAGAKLIHTDIFVLLRGGQTKTNIERGLQASHCPNCGGSVSSSAATACEYCGTVINDGALDWVLEYRAGPYDPWIKSLREAMAAQPRGAAGEGVAAVAPGLDGVEHHGGLTLAAWLVNVMMADGQVDPKEQRVLEGYGKRAGLRPEEIESLITSAHDGTLELESPDDEGEIRAWLTEMAAMALADGRVSREENRALVLLGGKLGYGPVDISQLINRTRTQLYRQSRGLIREVRAS
ncbi:import inner membrane translocase subunit Tim44 [Haloferula helveola]|uniref:Import inner membrane translocase subunit Tim44 n=1 Tax=Haloferula helveola TaxID=490095 RepID=A0ABN6H347_9BACT|nr:import inner membrane translocase subunit Tim44 [Haloferula helveola]